MDFRGYLRAIRRSLWLIVLCMVVLGALAALHARLQDDVYESRARVIVSASQAEITEAYAGGLLSAQRAATYAEVVGSDLMAQNVRDVIGDRLTLDELRDHVSATSTEKSQVVELRFTASDPELAQQVAQAYADELVEVAAQIEKPDQGGEPPTKITVLDPASLQLDPVAPKPVRDVALALVLGLVLGIGIALLRELFNTRINSDEDLDQVTDAPVLANIAQFGGGRRMLVTDLTHNDPRVEAFRVLRTNVQFVDVDAAKKVLVVTSSLPEEGKTSTASNLALTLARAGIRILLVDCDLRRPRVASAFGIDDTAGVTTVLLGKIALEEAVWTHEETGLHVLPSGIVPPNASELLQTQAMTNLLKSLRSSYDTVILDTPPLLPVTDAAILAASADGTMVVVRHGKTRREQLAGALERLRQVDIVPAGLVLNGIPVGLRRLGYYGGYATYGGYGGHTSYTGSAKSRGQRRRRRGPRE